MLKAIIIGFLLGFSLVGMSRFASAPPEGPAHEASATAQARADGRVSHFVSAGPAPSGARLMPAA